MKKDNIKQMKLYLKYFFLFCFFLLCLMFFFTVNRGDTYVNYGFSYAVSNGQIPYKDFNMIITPFAPFLYSVGLIFSKSILVFYLEQALFLTILFYFLFRLLKEKAWLFLLGMIIPFPITMSTTIFPGYNFLLFFLLILLFYSIKMRKSDFIIGIILGLFFCTKQTIGAFLLIPSFYYLFKDKKKFFSRILGWLIPVGIMILYLLITGSFINFIDLCFLGLFNFGSNNTNIDYFYLGLLVLGICYLVFKIFKDKYNYVNYYVLIFSLVSLPIIDYYHVSLFLLGVLFVFLDSLKIDNINYSKHVCVLIFVVCLLWCFVEMEFFDEPVIVSYNNFPLTIVSNKYDRAVKELNKFTNDCDYDVIYLMRGSENYFYKIINDREIDYFDLPNYGNYGFNGISKMIDKINNEKNVIIVVDRELINNNESGQQYIKELGLEVVKSSEIIKSVGNYDIYFKE